MYFVNEYEVESIANRSLSMTHSHPNTRRGAQVLVSLMAWTNRNSDGWAYWPKPMRAAAKLAKALEERTIGHYGHRVDTDITASELKAALSPIKAFLTRQGTPHSEINGLEN